VQLLIVLAGIMGGLLYKHRGRATEFISDFLSSEARLTIEARHGTTRAVSCSEHSP
jgi:hypothetical protein